MTLPPPVTFSDGERRFFGRWVIGAGICYGIAAVSAASLIAWGNWPPELAKLRLIALWTAMAGATFGSIAVTIALAVGGPVGRFKAQVSREGASVEAGKDDDDAA